MASYSLWENLLLALLVMAMLFWMGLGIKATIEKSRTAKSDWPALIVPLGFVVMLVIFLIVMV